MADAKQCDITGEFFEATLDNNRKYDIWKDNVRLDIGPTLYRKICILFQTKTVKKRKAKWSKENIENARLRQKLVMSKAKKIQARGGTRWRDCLRLAHAEIQNEKIKTEQKEARKQALKQDNSYMTKAKSEYETAKPKKVSGEQCLACGSMHSEKGDICENCLSK